ncbi:MAG: bifunctional 4-hydroxy-3-methylbut-2-enyl diphosphate reductase/30S ribosomal protein S1 [Clostridiales bacterium]|nr:bifunctional 4-hydroxy-3-methylbut-2-enyl diphosphate reductase/30S ribosomal protein S1 [Clostridiales bacterium]
MRKVRIGLPVIVAKNAGFCFGVRRAVEAAERALASGRPVYTLGPLIHNAQVVSSLSARGICPVDSAEDIPGGAVAVIRSHGVAPGVVQALTDRGVQVVDATCPFVERVHQMAAAAANAGTPVLVVGDPNHPEVRGTLGWAAGLGRAVPDRAAAEALEPLDSALVVAQTTLDGAEFQTICAAIATRVAHPDIQNTICLTTVNRQREAASIAAQADVMVVVGGRHSANSLKLAALCGKVCPDVRLIENARELDAASIKPGSTIGIAAGASTPDGTFKEVVARMNDIENQANITEPAVEQQSAPAPAEQPAPIATEGSEHAGEGDFMADVEKTLVQIRAGQTITGTVVQITDDEVCVNVGYKADGLVKKADLSSTDVKIGDEIEVEVVKVNDGEGNVLLSQRNIVNRKHWEEIVAASEAGVTVKGVGKSAVKGGLIADVNGVRAFIPASLLSLRYVEKIEEFVGQELDLKIIEIDKAKKRAVASHKAVLLEQEAARKKALWNQFTEGEVVHGIVRRLTNFGAFVDIGGIDGLVHVTDMSWSRVNHPSEVLSVNQEINVKILKLDPERERISLSYKQTLPKPWDVAGEKYAPGMIVTGKVVRIIAYGAFVELEPGLDGMVHISQCALRRIARVEDAVQVGDVIRVKILSVDTENKRIGLSIREALEDEAFEGVSAVGEALDETFAMPEPDQFPGE